MQDHLTLFTCHLALSIPLKVPIIGFFPFQQSRRREFTMYESVREFVGCSQERKGKGGGTRVKQWEIRE
jgi:hypothetical protein